MLSIRRPVPRRIRAGRLGRSRRWRRRGLGGCSPVPEYGFTPSDHQRDLRLRRARALLAEGTAPSTAAVEAGFADQAHLTRWFTRTYGVTPAAYRMALQREPGTQAQGL
ncbi:helix-turn-helix domain-containing protein [Kitasatospora sp. NPDC004669]|uniref:helix-turn-helix domain-containing protein n=1 Tax=Kitasatospora sp. NPDC004669 TaxID=3154555 RepID=UPI0033AF0AEF